MIILIQAIQIGTVQATWFPMAILQAINGFFYQACLLIACAYLPEIRSNVGDETMTNYNSRFFVMIFGNNTLYLITVTAISTVLKADDILTGQIGQGVNVIVSGMLYALGFYFFSDKEPKRSLPPGTSLATAGLKHVFVTAKGIIKYYPSTLTWFLLAVIFTEASKC